MAERPIPRQIDPLYQPYFDGLSQGKVLAPQCDNCGELQWPPQPMCPHCHGVDFTQVEMPAQATVFTFSTAYRAFHPWFAERTPYHMVVGDFGNGVRIVGNLWDQDLEIKIGMPIVPSFARAGDLTILEWKPA